MNNNKPTLPPWRYAKNTSTAWGETFLICGGTDNPGDVKDLIVGHALTEEDARLITHVHDLAEAVKTIRRRIACEKRKLTKAEKEVLRISQTTLKRIRL